MQKHILIVDDDPGMVLLLEEVLQHEGFSTHSAGDGRGALDLLQKGLVPQLILLDLIMPHMNGWEFMEQLRILNPLRSIPVIVMTGTYLRTPQEQLPYIIFKPFDFEQLLHLIDEISLTTEKSASNPDVIGVAHL